MATKEPGATPATTRGGAITVVAWTLQILLALFFIVFEALPKLTGDAKFVEIFDMVGLGQWLRYFVGVAELAGGIGLLIPRLAGLAALGLSCITVGAVITQLFVLGAQALALIPAFFTAILLLVVWLRGPETRSVLRSLGRSVRSSPGR